jgi:hypothetical protein
MSPAIPSLLAALALIPAISPAATYTYPDLVGHLTDLEALATPPEPGETTALASSYDRASQYDAAHDRYIRWDANSDGGGYVRKDGDKIVMADIKGPGCIWRTWTATAGEGHVKIYLDGNPSPAVDLPFSGYFNGLNLPFTRPRLVYRTAANGFDNYTPIPFQKSCKIVADPGWGNYFHFNYTQFPPDTVVPTFKLPLCPEDDAALDAANHIFNQCGHDPAGPRPGERNDDSTLTVGPGKTATVFDLAGPRAITGLRLWLQGMPDGIDAQATFMRQLVLRITWDNQRAPAVWCPLGDYFGDAAGATPYLSLPCGLTRDGEWYSYWYMPFASRALVEVENEGPTPVTMSWKAIHSPLTHPADALLRFHAKWHRDLPGPRMDRWPDWILLDAHGRGRFVGTQLHVWNPNGGWWGEGDEKFFVDREKFPSTFGTGSEDYFGFAWCSSTPFNEPLHGQTVNQGNAGHASLHRWHIADNVPFQQTFEASIEKYFSNDRPTLYATAVFWYLAPDGADPYGPIPVEDRIGYWRRPPLKE